jgi:hypothetical protein
MVPRRLTDEDEAELVLRYRRGASLRQLADRFGVHHATVERILTRQGVPLRPPSESYSIDTDTIVELRDGPGRHSWAEIAMLVRMSPSGVRRRYWDAKACRSDK